VVPGFSERVLGFFVENFRGCLAIDYVQRCYVCLVPWMAHRGAGRFSVLLVRPFG
jgi:hypothetical protein